MPEEFKYSRRNVEARGAPCQPLSKSWALCIMLPRYYVVDGRGRSLARLFRDDDLDSAFSPQNIDADILRMTFKREINCGVSNPEILHLNVFQERR